MHGELRSLVLEACAEYALKVYFHSVQQHAMNLTSPHPTVPIIGRDELSGPTKQANPDNQQRSNQQETARHDWEDRLEQIRQIRYMRGRRR